MELFVLKIIPFYILIFVGFIATRKLEIHTESIGKLLIYVITPMVALTSIMRLKVSTEVILLPIVFFICCTSLSILALWLGKRMMDKPSASILAYMSATANTGYFGLPLTEALLGKDSVGIAMLVALGYVLYENSIGFFIASNGKHSVRESILRVLKLPSLYACTLGTLASWYNFRPEIILSLGDNFRGAYSVLGMLLIGIGVGNAKKLVFFKPYFQIAFGFKFLLAPLFVVILLTIDRHLFGVFHSVKNVMLLQAATPLPAFGVAMAALFNTRVPESATVVLSSTLASMIIIPAWILIYQMIGLW